LNLFFLTYNQKAEKQKSRAFALFFYFAIFQKKDLTTGRRGAII
jgi:hypothetical protein